MTASRTCRGTLLSPGEEGFRAHQSPTPGERELSAPKGSFDSVTAVSARGRKEEFPGRAPPRNL